MSDEEGGADEDDSDDDEDEDDSDEETPKKVEVGKKRPSGLAQKPLFQLRKQKPTLLRLMVIREVMLQLLTHQSKVTYSSLYLVILLFASGGYAYVVLILAL
ncbi:hypothetical protein QYF36_013423 [Acer negundo]|nr:hypothetical protein QYF36_013423 [Acer negundo]